MCPMNRPIHTLIPWRCSISTRTRRRELTDWYSQYGNYVYKQWSGASLPGLALTLDVNQKNPAWDTLHQLFHGQQYTADSTHGIRSSRDLIGHGIGDVGGDFFSQKKYAYAKGGLGYISFDRTGVISTTWFRSKYSGPCLATSPADNKFPVFTQRDLSPYGGTAVARCKPTNNVANLATTIAETVREGLPHLIGVETWEHRTKAAKAAGSEYLNYEFGWVPLVSDIRGASYAAHNAHRILSSYERNSGRQVRRRYEFPLEKTESVSYLTGDGTLMTSAFLQNVMYDASKPVPTIEKRTTFSRRTWFSGAFTYHLPVGYKSRNRVAAAAAKAGPLLGIELTPETVWNALPWTWAIDWFSNTGDVVSNISDWSTDGLVMRYGYIMEHTLQEITYTMIGPTRYHPYGSQYSSPLTFCVETKRRQKATPFGFGVTWNSFTPRQLAIASALGLSRS